MLIARGGSVSTLRSRSFSLAVFSILAFGITANAGRTPRAALCPTLRLRSIRKKREETRKSKLAVVVRTVLIASLLGITP
jgi:hypothetical protein